MDSKSNDIILIGDQTQAVKFGNLEICQIKKKGETYVLYSDN